MNKTHGTTYDGTRATAKRYFSFLALFCLLIASQPAQALTAGSHAPSFKLLTPTGAAVSLADFRGKPVLLKIGTTWCPACQQQEEELSKADAALKAAGITIIDVFVEEDAQTVQTYQKGRAMKTPMVTLLGDKAFVRDYGIYLIPRLLLLNPEQGIIRDGGMLSADELRQLVSKPSENHNSPAIRH